MHISRDGNSSVTMADECDVSRMVTKFFLNTCRLNSHPSLSKRDIQAAVCCGVAVATHPPGNEEVQYIPLVTGSVAEFYVEPMLPYAGDIDIMHHYNNELATPQGHPPPTQLPAKFHHYVKVHEITNTHLSGYVYLLLRYILIKCIDTDNYNCIERDESPWLYFIPQMDHNGHSEHGPAVITKYNDTSALLSVDFVRCIRCLVWPPQADDWPTRHRNYGWPDSATLDRVVTNGYDVVGVAHRQCKQLEPMGKFQWRLSFSRAEIVLINSWMPVQQIVYHMLRYFIKTERLTDCADNSGAGTLSNYHIKTLMLWACELKSKSWWTGDLNLVRICVELLYTFSVWLTDTRCPHYFINDNYCNLLDNSFNVGSVASKLMSIDEKYLSTWFVNNYIGKCAQFCPDNVSRLFSDSTSSMDLQTALSEIIEFRQKTSLTGLWRVFYFAEKLIAVYMPRRPNCLTTRTFVYWKNELTKIDRRFSVYFLAVSLLQIACIVLTKGFNNELMNVLTIIPELNSNQGCNVFYLRKTNLNTSELVEFLQKSAVGHLTTYRQLVARDFGSAVTIVTTDFEALYAYKRGDYQRCLQSSTQNVHALLYARRMPGFLILSMFVQLLDDDIVSLTALRLFVKPQGRKDDHLFCITQLTLSLYLMTQCQLKLRHSVTSLAKTLHCVKVAQRKYPHVRTLDHLTFKLIQRKVQVLQKQ